MKRHALSLFFLLCLTSSLYAQQKYSFSIFFDYSQYLLRPEAVADLEGLVDRLQGASSYQIQLTGYAGQEGLDDFTQSLSERRAWAVYRYLIRRHLDNGRITIAGMGQRQPVNPNATERARARNRRVDVKVIYTPGVPAAPEDSQASVGVPGWSAQPESIRRTFTGPNGTLIHVPEEAFSPFSPDSIRMKIEDYYDPMQMMRKGLSTVDDSGRCLETQGMVFLEVNSPQGRALQPNEESPLLMEMPSGDFDEEIRLYRAVSIDSSLRWAPDTALIQQGDRQGYVVRLLRAGGFNLDKPLREPPLQTEPPKVLAKGFKNPRVFIAHQNKRSWNQLTHTGKRLYQNLEGCDCGGQNPVLIAFAEKKGVDYLAEIPLDKMRYQGGKKNRYVLRGKYYVALDPAGR